MSNLDPATTVAPSILDRLINASLSSTRRLRYSLDEYIQAIQRDVEDLLNTRQTHQGLCDDLDEVGRSIVAYGMPDLSSFQAVTVEHREAIAARIAEEIRRFEPRLLDVRVTLTNTVDLKSRHADFRVDAKLALDPAPDLVFETTFDLATGRYRMESKTP